MKKTADLEASVSNPPDSLKAALTEALEDEYRARAVYRMTLDKFGNLPPFANIVEAEERHVQALLPLFSKYGIPILRITGCSDWRLLTPCRRPVRSECRPKSAMRPCMIGCLPRLGTIQMFSGCFQNLQRASQENHLQAFQQCVAGVVSSETTKSSGNLKPEGSFQAGRLVALQPRMGSAAGNRRINSAHRKSEWAGYSSAQTSCSCATSLRFCFSAYGSNSPSAGSNRQGSLQAKPPSATSRDSCCRHQGGESA